MAAISSLPGSSARHGWVLYPNHHPLYQPPLPTPPLASFLEVEKHANLSRRSRPIPDSTDDDDDDDYYTPTSSRSRRRRQRPSSARTVSNSTITSSYSNLDRMIMTPSIPTRTGARQVKTFNRHVLLHSRRPSGSDSPSPFLKGSGQRQARTRTTTYLFFRREPESPSSPPSQK
jgi:hypothetical protein